MLDEHRASLHDCVNGLDEEEARRSLVPSRTTLLGLVKHVTYVERFYFDHCVTGRSLKEIGVAATPDRSFILTGHDTIASVQAAHRVACAESRRVAAGLDLHEVVTGRGEQPVWSIYLRTLRDLAQHCGHADILREQVLAARAT
ncbi:MAG: DinB family protein [Umezawaea sp.]